MLDERLENNEQSSRSREMGGPTSRDTGYSLDRPCWSAVGTIHQGLFGKDQPAANKNLSQCSPQQSEMTKLTHIISRPGSFPFQWYNGEFGYPDSHLERTEDDLKRPVYIGHPSLTPR